MFRIALILIGTLLQAGVPDPVKRLDVYHQPFLDDFRASDGRVRLVTLLSPT